MKKIALFLLLLASSAWALPTQKVNITGSAALNVLKAGDTMTGPLINSTAGAASTPAFTLTGTPYTGGTATTTKPLVLIETSGATSSAWNTNGAMLGVNSPSGFTGNLIDLHSNGTQRFAVTAGGAAFSTALSVSASGIYSSANNVTLNLGLNRAFSSANMTQVKIANQTDSSSSGTGTAVAITPTYNQTSTAGATDLLINRTETAIGSGTHLLLDAQVGGTSKFSVTRTGVVQAPTGAAATPGYAFGGDPNTGVYSPAADQIALSAGGTTALTASATAVYTSLQIGGATGTANSPSFTINGDWNTGMYWGGADKLAFSAGGTKRMEVTTAGVTFDYGVQLTTGTQPTCDSSARGMFWHTAGGAGVKDAVEVCAKDAGDAYAWRTIY